ncbi:MAG: hypothetical protein ACRC20_05690 [Segniliparus sp.]|uniref:hypothetical protein n=1 Tax=Segniliparus sp. TaxID=2804064 RepID=UPI003F3B0169
MAYTGGFSRYGYGDVGPRVKQYGYVPEPDEEQIDPKVLESERWKADEARRLQESVVPQSRLARRWTPDRGLVYETASTAIGAKPPRLPSGELDSSKDFPEPAPPKPPVNLVTDFPFGGAQ